MVKYPAISSTVLSHGASSARQPAVQLPAMDIEMRVAHADMSLCSEKRSGMSSGGDPIVECTSLSKQYPLPGRGSLQALKDVSLVAARGEIVGIVGLNGSGKTTLLRIIAGLMYPSTGQAQVTGQSSVQALQGGRIGMLAEEPAFSRALTAKQYWEACLRIGNRLGTPSELPLDLLGVKSFWGKKVGQLSKGMIQRFGLSLCLAYPRDVYVLDEPTDGLDLEYRWHLADLLRRIRDRGSTILYSSHNMTEIDSICDRILILSKGRLSEHFRNRDSSTVVYRRVDEVRFLDGLRAADIAASPQRGSVVVRKDQINEACRLILDLGGDILEIKDQSTESFLRDLDLEDGASS